MTGQRRHLALAIALALLCWLCMPPPVIAQTATADQIKAAYLFNFAKFVEWPAESLPTAGAALTFCTLGISPVAEALDSTLTGKTINGHNVVLRRLQGPEEAKGCHVLFLAAGAGKQAQKLLQASSGLPVLLVADSPGFARSGGSMNFVMESGRVSFEINAGAAEAAHLKISSKLLSLAHIVSSSEERARQ